MTTDVFHHPWLGGLFSDPELSALLSPDRTLEHMVWVEAEFLRAQGRIGRIASNKSEKAARAVEHARIDIEQLRVATGRDGVAVPELARQLRAAVDPNLSDVVHTGLTSQDVVDTALVLSLKDVIVLFDQRLETLAGAFGDLSLEHGANLLMGRTRMQAAEGITVADRIAKWERPLSVHRERLSEVSDRVLQLQCGGAVGNRAAFGAEADKIAEALAKALGLGRPGCSWHAERDGLAEFASWLSLVSGSLGKMGQDIALMAQQGIDEIALSGGGGSSAMPHKQNPVAAETLITLARFNATQISGMHHAMVHEQERSGSAWALEWMILPQMIFATGRGLGLAIEQVGKVETMGKGAKQRGSD